MALDALFLAGLRRELAAALIGARVDRIGQPSRPSLIFHLRGEQTRHLCLWAGTAPRVWLSETGLENPPEPPMFCMLLRKYLTGARVVAVDQPELDRLLTFTFACSDLFGGSETRTLTVELLGRAPNVILTDGDGVITDCLYRAGGLGEKRAVLPGLRYEPPTGLGKMDPRTADAAVFGGLFRAAEGGAEIAGWLCGHFAGLAPLTARELVFRAYGETDTRVADALAKDGGAALAASWDAFAAVLRGGGEPCILRDETGTMRELACMPIRQYGSRWTCERAESFSRAVETFYASRNAEERRRQLTADITKQVKTRRERVARRLGNQQRELAAAADRETLRENGDLLTSSLHVMKKGMASFEAEDYYRGGTRVIRLDPLKTPQQNAAAYYKDYTKAKNAEKILTTLVAEGREELAYLDSVLAELAMAETLGDAAEIKSELADAGVLKAPRDKKRKAPKPARPMAFTAPDGTRVLVGRNNVQNDALTFKTARRDDLWLHVQKLHGCHAVICCAGAEPAEATLLYAAGLAAWFSDGRNAGKVPVDYTRVRFVKKPAGGRPGAVLYTDYKTVVVSPRAPEGTA